MNRRTLLAAGLAVPIARAHAQGTWTPNRPIRFIVPFVAGGSTDVGARFIADHMSSTLGQPVIVENRGGSGGNIGGDIVAKAPPDGYTLLMGVTGLLSTNRHIYRQMPFDPDRDLAPVSMAYTADMAIVVTNKLNVTTLAEFVTLAKANPGKFSFGSSGHGASTHTAAELFRQQAGIDMVHVPYRGSGAAMNDLIAGNIEMMLVQIAGAAGSIRANQVRALAATGPRRHPLIPDVPTIAEAGYPQAEATSWGCVMVPAGTPTAVVQRLSQAVAAAVADPTVASRMSGAGVDGVASTPEELASFLRSESAKWGAVARQAGIRVE
ncbi:tripartite tricarboxylate transporter substrate binding protein [Roseomonas sp. HJA6]|uniref:Tripartite tricarboxylate transporter substrate binding protein n=1 Tax=Roseomonas alba TaxID=2846776 RepID=A0ABS7AGD0_9PROT|nr:tripartite tricarboxylate transporter substrate binding protein [Neoroseomonas alba]MBW6400234.1 tripartite tricarboxylate transporter substrate binding protein [Neoroseomonas alba]